MTTEIRIGRRTYKVASDEWQPLYIQKLAGEFEKELVEAEKETGIVDDFKLFVIAGLRLVDKMFKLQELKSGNSDLADKEIEDLNSQLKEILY